MEFTRYLEICASFAARISAVQKDTTAEGLTVQADLCREVVLFLTSAGDTVADPPYSALEWAEMINEEVTRMSRFLDWLERRAMVAEEDELAAVVFDQDGQVVVP